MATKNGVFLDIFKKNPQTNQKYSKFLLIEL